jgi:hypothetical protein
LGNSTPRTLRKITQDRKTINALTDTVKKHPWYASALGAIVLYALLGFLVAPYLLQKTLVETMQRDFAAGLRIEKIEINPFVLSLRVTGVELDNPAGEPTARIQEIFANFQLSSIFRLALTFDEVRFSAPELFVARNRSGELDIAYLTNTGTDKDTEGKSAGEQDSSLLRALIYRFSIENCFINWSDAVPQDAVETRFGPIDIAIGELNTLPDRTGRQTVTIATQNSGTLSWTGDLQLNPLHSSGKVSLEDSHFPLASTYIRHQTGFEIANGSAGAEMEYEVHATADGEIEASMVNIELTFTDIVVNSFADGTGFDFAGEDQKILTLPRIHLSGGQFHWPEKTVLLASISIENPEIEVSRDADGVFSLEPRATPPAEQDATATAGASVAGESDQGAAGQPWQFSLGKLSINRLVLNLLDQTVSPAARLGFTDFDLAIDDISNLAGKRFPTRLSLQALSGGIVTLTGEMALLPDPLFDFDVNVDALQLKGVQPYIAQQANLSLDSGAVNLDGHISSDTEEPLLFKGNLAVVDLEIAESVDHERFASWKSFSAENIALSLAEQQLDISRLRFDGLYGDILIHEDGSVNINQIEKVDTEQDAAETAATDAAGEAGDQSPAMKIRIGDVVLADASADFSDLSLPLPFAAKIDSLNGNMTTISTTSSEPSEVSFEGKVDEFGFARVSGYVTPLTPTKNTNLLLSFENIDVPRFSPYSIPFAGRKIASGRLDLKLGYTVKDSQLVGENSIVLRDFELGEKVPHPDALNLPLGLAVALLKDANGKIDIDLPVRGNLDDPEFSYGNVVLGALGNLLTRVVLSPFSALASLLGIEANELEYINFRVGRSDLTPPEMEKAGKLAEALKLRPELAIGIAGVTDADADGLALRTARLDGMLEQRIAALTASSDPSAQYADLRRMALEQLFGEQQNVELPEKQLEELQQKFTALVAVEGQADPVASFDGLAYSQELRDRLIAAIVIDDSELATLASARAEALRTALLAIDATLQDRIRITESQAVTRADNETIQMKVTLDSLSE